MFPQIGWLSCTWLVFWFLQDVQKYYKVKRLPYLLWSCPEKLGLLSLWNFDILGDTSISMSTTPTVLQLLNSWSEWLLFKSASLISWSESLEWDSRGCFLKKVNSDLGLIGPTSSQHDKYLKSDLLELISSTGFRMFKLNHWLLLNHH